MLELYIDADNFRSMMQFHGAKAAVGLKPMLVFSGTPFENPIPDTYTLAKSLLTDLFKGQDAASVDVEGLQYTINFSVGEPTDTIPKPTIHMRVYKISTKKSGQKLPRVEVEEMGPRIDFRIGRIKEAEEMIMRESLKRPKQLVPKTKKNIETDLLGDKIGRIHVGKQDLKSMQTRKMKGLKRHLDNDDQMQLDDPVKIARLD